MTAPSRELTLRLLIERALTDPAWVGRAASEAAARLCRTEGGQVMVILDLPPNAAFLNRRAFAFSFEKEHRLTQSERVDLRTTLLTEQIEP